MPTEKSILAIDYGSLVTKATLFDYIEGRRRVVAQGRAVRGLGSFEENMAEALGDIETATQRIIWSNGAINTPEDDCGNGVDEIVTSTSSRAPLRAALLCVTEGHSLVAARKAVECIKAEIIFSTALEGIRAADNRRNRAESLANSAPDVVLMAGGTNGRARKQLEELCRFLASTKLRAPGGEPLPVILAASEETHRPLVEILGPLFELHPVPTIQNSENTLDLASAVEVLETIYLRNTHELVRDSHSFGEGPPILPVTKALGKVALFLSRYHSCKTLLLDVGSECVSAFFASSNGLDKKIVAGTGMGKAAHRMVSAAGLWKIARWLTSSHGPDVVANYLLNKSLRPYTVAQSDEETEIEQAVLREAIRLLQVEAPDVELVVATGGPFRHPGLHGSSFLIILDGLELTGVTSLKLDTLGILPSIGALSLIDPNGAAEVAVDDALTDLGTAIAPAGSMTEGGLAITAMVKYPDGSRLEVQVPFGSLEVVPLETGATASVSIQLAPSLTMKPGSTKKSFDFDVKGGTVGIVFDGRGRPLQSQERSFAPSKMTEWSAVLKF